MTTEQIRQAILKKHPDAIIGQEPFGSNGQLLMTITLPRKGLRHRDTVWAVGSMKDCMIRLAKKLNAEIT